MPFPEIKNRPLSVWTEPVVLAVKHYSPVIRCCQIHIYSVLDFVSCNAPKEKLFSLFTKVMAVVVVVIAVVEMVVVLCFLLCFG